MTVPTAAQLDTDGRSNTGLVKLALALAKKASNADRRALPARDDYVDALVDFATDARAGHVPPEQWQLRHLGHLITEGPAR